MYSEVKSNRQVLLIHQNVTGTESFAIQRKIAQIGVVVSWRTS